MKARIAALPVLLCFALGAPAYATTVIFDDGAVDGSTNGYFIDGPGAGPFQQTVSNGFVATNSGSATSLDFGEWVLTGTTPTSVSWALGTSAFGSDIGSGFVAQVGYTYSSTNVHGYDVYVSHIDGLSGSLSSGSTYYLTLGDGNDSSGSQYAAWDVNGGPATCTFAVAGTPQGSCGSDGGETFTIYSDGSGVPEPGSMLLLGSGFLGLVCFRRRRLSH